MNRPSDGMTLDELRDEFDWIYEFQSHIAERIRGDDDVHSEVGYVRKLESDNAKLREVASMMASHYLPNDLRMSLDKWHKRDEQIRNMLTELGIEVKE